MLGKCLWKMCCHPELKPEKAPKVTFDDALSAFSNAIRYVPERRDNRHPEKDPILEPHYKTVSIVQKLVQRKLLQVSFPQQMRGRMLTLRQAFQCMQNS